MKWYLHEGDPTPPLLDTKRWRHFLHGFFRSASLRGEKEKKNQCEKEKDDLIRWRMAGWPSQVAYFGFFFLFEDFQTENDVSLSTMDVWWLDYERRQAFVVSGVTIFFSSSLDF